MLYGRAGVEGDDFSFRKAVLCDAAALARLAGQLGYPSSQEVIAERLRRAIDSATREIVVVEEAGAVIAWIELTVRDALESGEWAEISGLVVDEARRGEGVGEKLVAYAIAWGRGRGCVKLRVRTNVLRERTHRFYERCGFVTDKSQRVYDLPLTDA